MPVEAETALHRRRAERIEQGRGGFENEIGDHGHRLVHLDVGDTRRMDRRFSRAVDVVGPLQGLRRLEDDGARRIGRTAHAPHHLLHLGIVASPAAVAVAVDPLALGHEPRHVDGGRTADAGQSRQMDELEEPHRVGETLRIGLDQLRPDEDVREDRRAARGERLAETVPIVDDLDTRRPRRHGRHQGCARLVLGRDVDPVGEERAGGVEFPAVEQPLPVLRPQHRIELPDLGLARLGHAAADGLAIADPGGPARPPFRRGRAQHVLREAEMRAQGVGDVGIRLRQLNEEVEQFGQARAMAALFACEAQGGEARLFQPVDLVMGERAREIAGDGGGADAREDRPETGR